jgi:hypothetical protein
MITKSVGVGMGTAVFLAINGCGGGGSPSPSPISTTQSAAGGASSNPSNNGVPNSSSNIATNINNNTPNPAVDQAANIQLASKGFPLSFYGKSVYNVNNSLVAFSRAGTKAISTDGENWSVLSTPTNIPLDKISHVAFENGKYFALTQPTGIFASSDGITWGTTTGGISNPSAVAYGASTYVSVGQVGQNGTDLTLAYSSDGVTWTTGPANVNSKKWNGIVFANNKFVAVGEQGYSATSSDGISWTVNQFTADTNAVFQWVSYAAFFSPGRYVAVGNRSRIFYSLDGATWTELNSAGGPNSDNALRVTCFSSRCIVATIGGDYHTASTPTGTPPSAVAPWDWWVYGNASVRQQFPWGFAQLGSKWIGVGDNGTLITSTNGYYFDQVPSRP